MTNPHLKCKIWELLEANKNHGGTFQDVDIPFVGDTFSKLNPFCCFMTILN